MALLNGKGAVGVVVLFLNRHEAAVFGSEVFQVHTGPIFYGGLVSWAWYWAVVPKFSVFIAEKYVKN